MKIALLGYGKMGRLIEQFAGIKGHQIIARFSKELGAPHGQLDLLSQAEVALDFSNPTVALEHVMLCTNLRVPLVIGTTGWENQLAEAQEFVKKLNGTCLFAPNFSKGNIIFQLLIKKIAPFFESMTDYDVHGTESHHEKKIDRPSGTAKALAELLKEQIPRLKNFDFKSIRVGDIPGTHTLTFSSQAETLTISHEAHNRNGFAEGALQAAEWLHSRKGFYTMNDMMQDLFPKIYTEDIV